MIAAIIVAAGKSTRMGSGIDKLFLEVAGRPVLGHTWRRCDTSLVIDEIVIVARAGTENALTDMAARFNFTKPYRLVAGGKERQDSVWNGLQALKSEIEIVVIQDAARPCTADELIRQTIDAARQVGAAVAAQRVTDTLKESADGKLIERTVDRSRLWAVQTPQTFRVEIIRRALAMVRERGLLLTDDTAACELIGQPVALIESTYPNPKITAPADIPYLESLLRSRCADQD